MTKLRSCVHPRGKFGFVRRGAVQIGSKCDEEKVPPANERKQRSGYTTNHMGYTY